MKLIGICGKAGSGKDTTANVLVEERGFVIVSLADAMKRFLVEVYGFTEEQCWGPSEKRNAPDFRYPRPGEEAREARERFIEILAEGFDDWEIEEAAEAGWLTPRYALQQLGTEWGRAMYLDTWIDIVIRTAMQLLKEPGKGETNILQYTSVDGLYYVDSCTQPKLPKGVIVPDIRYPNEAEAIRTAGGKVYKLDRPSAGLSGTAGQHTSETRVDLVKEDARIFNDAGLGELRQRVLAVTDSYARDEVRP